MGNEWFSEWFDENYLLIYKHRNMEDAGSQFDLILKEVVPEKGWKILDLACGEGRYSSLFKNRGYNITGIDLSEILIQSGKEKFPGLKLEACDMRKISGKFDLILSLFTSFGYFEDEKEDRKVISGVYNSLNPGGLFWIDFFNSEYIKNTLIKKSSTIITEGVTVKEEREITGGRINKKIIFESESGKKEYFESVRMYTKNDLVEMINSNRLKVEKIFGDYAGSEWDERSERVIIVCRKQA